MQHEHDEYTYYSLLFFAMPAHLTGFDLHKYCKYKYTLAKNLFSSYFIKCSPHQKRSFNENCRLPGDLYLISFSP